MKRPKDNRRMKRAARLGEASKKVRRESVRVNREFAAIEPAPDV